MGPSPLRPEDPRRLGDHQLLARLGEGGMGTVFLGRDPGGRLVAVKSIRAEFADREVFRARFRSEVNRVRQVPSFCTAAVVDADPDNEIPYLVVEYVDGPSLEEVVTERGPMSAGDLHSLAIGVAAALTAIHGAGVIHRDLKPTNVLLSPGLPKVIDFGIARALEATSQHTGTDQLIGTVAYMAPERLDPAMGEMTTAADIFAWGTVVAYAGTGRSPFGGDSPVVTAARILTVPPNLSGLPEPLAEVVGRALAKVPADRPTANELMQDLLAVPAPATGSTAGARPTTSAGGTGSRFDGRHLLEQLIAEGPKPVSAAPGPPALNGGRHHSPGGRRVPPALVRRVLYAVVALVLVTVAAATVASARTNDEPQAVAPSTAPSGDAPAVTTLADAGPVFSDPLSAPDNFPQSSGDTGSCKYEQGVLRARASGRLTYQCPGPADLFAGDQLISVDVNLGSPNSCAMVWFRYDGDRRYQLTACADHLVMEVIDGAFLTTTGRADSDALRPGSRHRLAITVTAQHASVAIDGVETLQSSSANVDIDSGRVLLGVVNARSTGTAEADFAALEVRAG